MLLELLAQDRQIMNNLVGRISGVYLDTVEGVEGWGHRGGYVPAAINIIITIMFVFLEIVKILCYL